jgi:hypothetical protein
MLHRGNADAFLDFIAMPLNQFSDDGGIMGVCPEDGA